MNTDDFNKIVEDLKEVSLSKEERDLLRKDFFANAGIVVTETAVEPPSSRPLRSPYYIFRSFQVGLAACLFIVASGGVAVYASTHSIPGDILYPLKRHVEEPIVRTFHAKSPSSKAEFEVQLVAERLDEVEKLIETRPLTSDEKNEFKVDLMAQTARAEIALNVLEPDDVRANEDNNDDSVSALTATSTMRSSSAPEKPISEKKVRLEKIFKDHENVVKHLDLDGPGSKSGKVDEED